jgi:PAS domain S-box-containing protein
LNMRDVHEVFPRNPGNEAFVRDLMAHGWQLNAAQSYDRRYDGSDIYVDNDVRAHIVDGRLHRFWGIVRDRSSRVMKERQLKTEVSQALDLLGSIPDPILVVNALGRVEGANPAVEQWLGWPLEELLGTKVDTLLRFDTGLQALFAAAGSGRNALRCAGVAVCSDGTELDCDGNLAAIAPAGPAPRFVLTLRIETPVRQKPARTVAGGRR